MKTGIIRRIDDLGRVAIPKEIRRKLNIKEGDPLELSLEGNKVILDTGFTGTMPIEFVYTEDIDKAPTAGVVPRSKIEEIFEEFEQTIMNPNWGSRNYKEWYFAELKKKYIGE